MKYWAIALTVITLSIALGMTNRESHEQDADIMLCVGICAHHRAGKMEIINDPNAPGIVELLEEAD